MDDEDAKMVKSPKNAKRRIAMSPRAASSPANGSQRSKRGNSKEKVNQKKIKSKNRKTDEDTADSKRSSRKLRNNKKSTEFFQASTKIIKRNAECVDKQSSRDGSEKNESTVSKDKKILGGQTAASSPNPKQICSETFGYGADFPDSFFDEPKIFEFKIEPPMKVPVLMVSKTLIIYEVPEDLSSQIEIGDILFKFNHFQLGNRREYTKQLSFALKHPEIQTLAFTILRPIRNKPIPELELPGVFSKLESPQGYEILPDHYDYLLALLIISPKCLLGMTIKAYNGKVYVSAIENSVISIAYKSLLVGDAILAIENKAVSGVKETDDLLSDLFADKKYVRLIIERAKTPVGLEYVKLALSAEKTIEINPRMAEDIIEICEQQISFMETDPHLKPSNKILARNLIPHRPLNSHVNVAPESVELPISTDVNNLTFLAPTPKIPTMPARTIGSFNPFEKAKHLLQGPRRKTK